VPAEERPDAPATWVNGASSDVLADEERLIADCVVPDDTALEETVLEGAGTDVVELVVEVVERVLTADAVEKVVHVDEVLKLEVDALELTTDVVAALALEVVEAVD
jgi:hypothetical protein